jgi:hypothetical protein
MAPLVTMFRLWPLAIPLPRFFSTLFAFTASQTHTTVTNFIAIYVIIALAGNLARFYRAKIEKELWPSRCLIASDGIVLKKYSNREIFARIGRYRFFMLVFWFVDQLHPGEVQLCGHWPIAEVEINGWRSRKD